MTRLDRVENFNNEMLAMRNYTMVMTTGNGSMVDKPRVRGWVVWQSKSLGDSHDFAKWFSNLKEAKTELGARQ